MIGCGKSAHSAPKSCQMAKLALEQLLTLIPPGTLKLPILDRAERIECQLVMAIERFDKGRFPYQRLMCLFQSLEAEK